MIKRMGLTSDLWIIGDRYANFDQSDARSWARAACAFCGGSQMIVIATTRSDPDVQWLRCVNCYRGAVSNLDAVSPATMPLDTPESLTGVDLDAWTEVRACLSVGAFTAATMMCRKLLFHIAVAHGLPEKLDNGRAPNFYAALNHLEEEGVFTKRMRPWVDRVKDVGNEVNHELVVVTKDEAMDVAEFTRQLIHLAYELPAMIGTEADDEAATRTTE